MERTNPGKSTLLSFIKNSLYGISKNKKGKEISDFEKYAPWGENDFSGKLKYQLDDKNTYEIFRDFRRKNPQIFDEKKSDISKQFNIDKTKGNEFFYEQTKIDEELFNSTFLINQQEVKLNNSNQTMLIQKISNLVGTGEDNVSFKLAMNRLNRKQLDEVGTERSREKPINILTREIEELQNEKEELEEYKDLKYEIEENKNTIQKRINDLENKLELANKIKKINDDKIIEDEKMRIQENMQEENEQKIYNLQEQKEEKENEEKRVSEKNKKIRKQQKSLNLKMILGTIILIILNILQFIFIKNKIINYIFLLTVPAFLIFSIILKNKIKNKFNKNELENLKTEKNKIENEIDIIKNNNSKIKNEISKMKNANQEKVKSQIDRIKSNEQTQTSQAEIENLLYSKNINSEIENIQNLISKNKIKIHELKLDKENIEPKLDNLSKLEEKLANDQEKLSNIQDKEKSIELAKETLSDAYTEMKEQVTPKFTKKLSEKIETITNGKYKKAMYSEEEGLIVELENGNYVTANKLSIGTIDQLYLSLRLSMIDDLTTEKLPIIMDESFAYYDNDRLKNILKYLSESLKDRQSIIFTCTNRERDILENEEIKFNYIEI